MTQNALNWFEIPVRDMERAQGFYETLLATRLTRRDFGGQDIAVFPYADGRVGGALLKSASPAPCADGSLVYLDAGPSLDAVLERAAGLGARVLQPRMELPNGIGCIAHITDSEGNRVGLHSRPA